MDTHEYIEKMKEIQNCILDYIDDEVNTEENYQNLISIINTQKIRDDRHKFKSFLHLLIIISNNHHRIPQFFEKIEKILNQFTSEIKNYFTNVEIFSIFKSNYRILLFLIQEKILTIDQIIFNLMIKSKDGFSFYPYYFSKEIKPFITDKFITQNKLKYSWIDEVIQKETDDFEEKRKKGENDDHICVLIRNDSIEEFITYVNINNYPVNSIIQHSIYETNQFLLKTSIAYSKTKFQLFKQTKRTSLIEYSAFFGSSQIFKYLFKNGADRNPSLWIYAIHGDNNEIIQILEEEGIQPPDGSYNECIKESIKCHHNHIVNYIENNLINQKCEEYLNIDFEKNRNENFFSYCFHYYNLAFLPKQMQNECALYYACEYDYYIIIAANNDNHEIIDLLFNFKEIKIEEKFFKGFGKLTQIKLPSSLTSIPYNAFGGCYSLIRIDIPSSITIIEGYAFNGCYSLTEIKIPSSVTKIMEFAFNGCRSLALVSFDEPSSLVSIGDNAFSICTSLVQISIPPSVTSIGDYAFDSCSSLKEVKISSSTTSISDKTFNACYSLKQIYSFKS